MNKKPQILLAKKETLARASTPSVLILLVCKHSDSLTTNAVIPCRDSFSSRQKQYKNVNCAKSKFVFQRSGVFADQCCWAVGCSMYRARAVELAWTELVAMCRTIARRACNIGQSFYGFCIHHINFRKLSYLIFSVSSVVSVWPSILNCQLSTVNCQLSTLNCQLSIVNCQLSIVNCQLSPHPSFNVN